MSDWGWKEKLERLWRLSFSGLSMTIPKLNLAMTEEIAVDLGTGNTRIYLRGEGMVINEPSIIALNIESNRVAAIGEEAKTLAIRQPRDIRFVRPIKDGAIADCEAAGVMLSQFIKRASTHRTLISPALLMCVPADMTRLEMAAYYDTARRAGAGKVNFIEEPYAAAAGGNLNLLGVSACMIVDLGAGATSIAVTSGGNIVYASTRRVGGCEIDRAIVRYLQLERMLEVTEGTAEVIKIALAAINGQSHQRAMLVRGRNLSTGLPEEFTVTSEEIYPLIQPALRVIKQQIRRALEEIPTGVSVDLLDSGITLSGGLSQLPGLVEHLHQDLGLDIRVAPNPMSAAILGAGSLLEQKSQATTLEATKEHGAAESRESFLT